jgi:DNA-binding MarR family transcriptional regulator
VTNVQGEGQAVKPPATTAMPGPEAREISRLLVELLRSGYVSQRARLDPGTQEAGGHPTTPSLSDTEAGSAPALPPAAGPISPHVIRAAIHIHDEGPQTVGQLAQGLGISQGWASRVVDELERAGYVERERDPDDRRVVRVRLTPMAVDRVESASSWQGGAVEAALTGMGPDERAVIAVFLRRFIDGTRGSARASEGVRST